MSKRQIVRSRNTAFRNQCGRCFYCDMPMWLKTPDELAAPLGLKTRVVRCLQCTAEHLQPKSEGGTERASNIAAACKLCNFRRHQRKSAPDPTSYRVLVSSRLRKGRWHAAQLLALLHRDMPPSFRLQ
jgi:hypothetical protein